MYYTVGGFGFYRHRIMALAAGTMTLEQYNDSKNFLVDHHRIRREEDRLPVDSPWNVKAASRSENNANPINKKRVRSALAKSVDILHVESNVTTSCESSAEAAAFIGVDPGSLRHYLNGRRKKLPNSVDSIWKATWSDDGAFRCTDAIRIPGAAEDDPRRLSPTTRPTSLLRYIGNDIYKFAKNVPNSLGYVVVSVGGGYVPLARLTFLTFKREEFEAKLSELPTGAPERSIQIDHIDGDSLNNSLENLRALTVTEHARKHSLAIDWVDDGWVIETFDCAADAARAVVGTDGGPLRSCNILTVCNGGNLHTRGRVFEYAFSDIATSRRDAKKRAKRKRSEIFI
jgi:hypothetical protein